MLQMRFGSLHELRLLIANSKDATDVVRWIAACVVVHNFIIVEGNPTFGMMGVFDNSDEDEPFNVDQQRAETESSVSGLQRRDSLFRSFCIAKGYQV
jgi:hypothetical protein